MALRIFERNLAAVKSEMRPLYVADAEHGFRLDLVDLESYVHGLKSALRKERETIKELKARFGVTPDGCEALAPFGETPKVRRRGTQDVRAGRGTP